MAIREKSVIPLADLNDYFKSAAYLNSTDVYGVDVDYETKTFKRLGAAAELTSGADFDGIEPWNRRTCILSDSGEVIAYKGDDGFTETGLLEKAVTVNGVTYPIGTPVQVMVEQRKFYYKVVPVKLSTETNRGYGNNLLHARYYVSVSPESLKYGFKLHPAFVENGNQNDVIYLSAYICSLYNKLSNGFINSQGFFYDNNVYSGTDENGRKTYTYKIPLENLVLCSRVIDDSVSRVLFSNGEDVRIKCLRKTVHNRGTGWESMYIATLSASQLLMLIECAGLDAEEIIGSSSYRGEENLINESAYIEGIYLSNFKAPEYYDENISGSGRNGQYYIADHDFENTSYHTFVEDLAEEPLPAPPYYASNIAAPILRTFNIGGVNTGFYYDFFGYSPDYDWLFVPSDCHPGKGSSKTMGFFAALEDNETDFTGEQIIIKSLDYNIYCDGYSYMTSSENLMSDAFFARMVFVPSKKTSVKE